MATLTSITQPLVFRTVYRRRARASHRREIRCARVDFLLLPPCPRVSAVAYFPARLSSWLTFSLHSFNPPVNSVMAVRKKKKLFSPPLFSLSASLSSKTKRVFSSSIPLFLYYPRLPLPSHSHIHSVFLLPMRLETICPLVLWHYAIESPFFFCRRNLKFSLFARKQQSPAIIISIHQPYTV